MKRLLLLLFITARIYTGFAQNTSNLKNIWLKTAISNRYVLISATTIDANNNVYFAGSFSDSIRLGSLTSAKPKHKDAFIAGFNSEGESLWINALKASNYLHIVSLFDDNNGNLLISGYFNDTLSIGKRKIITYNSMAAFMAVADTLGEINYINKIEGGVKGSSIFFKTGKNGSCYLSIAFSDSIVFGKKQHFIKSKGSGIAIIKFNKDLKVEKTFVLKGKGELNLRDMNVSNNNILFTGTFEKTLLTGNKSYCSKGRKDAFFVRLSDNLQCIDVKTLGSPYNDWGTSFEIDNYGNTYLAGTFSAKMKITKNDSLKSNGNTDVFLIKYDYNNKLMWANNYGGEAGDFLSAMSVNKKGNIYLAGNFRGEIKHNRTEVVSKKFSDNVFIIKYLPDGKLKYAESLGDTLTSLNKNLFTDNNGNIYLSGNFNRHFDALGSKSKITSDLAFYLTKLHDCDESQQVHLPADTSVCEDNYTIVADSGFNKYLWNSQFKGANTYTVDESGVYTVQTTDKYGCIATDTMVLTINIPEQVDLGEDITVQKGETVVLDAGNNFIKYSWNTGSRQQKLIVNTENTITKDYLYKVTTTDENNCTSTDKVLISVADGLNVKLYPNPATEWVTVEVTNINKKEKLKIQIITQKGQTVKEQIINNNSTIVSKKLNIHNLNAGEYFVLVTNNNRSETIKFIKTLN